MNTKLCLWSDLHNEFGVFKYEKKEEYKDMILVLAGDIGVGTLSQNFLKEACEDFKHVIFVCGNHEFYYGEYYSVIKLWQEFESNIPNFHFLHNEVRILDGVRFVGGTMWTSLNNSSDGTINACYNYMNDYEEVKIKIDDVTRTLLPADIIKFHAEFIEFLTKTLQIYHDGPTVVVTHHSPADFKKLQNIYKLPRNNVINYAYYAGLNDFIEKNPVELWCHGHTLWNMIIKLAKQQLCAIQEDIIIIELIISLMLIVG
jgi:hypothetical protein